MRKIPLNHAIHKYVIQCSDYVVIRHNYNKYEIVKHKDMDLYDKFIPSVTHYALLRKAYSPIVLDSEYLKF